MNSRMTLRLATLVLCTAAGIFSVFSTDGAQAAAPFAKVQAPGFYRMMLGDFEITALSDGTVDLPVDKLLLNSTPPKITKALARAYLKAPVETSVNAFLINTGSKLILVDAGAGVLFGPTLGKLIMNLKASGYQPEQVDEIYITHMHPDHVGGLVSEGKIVFPNVIVRADQHDEDFWLSAANLEHAPAANKGFFQGAMASVNPYVAAGKFKSFDGATELSPGISTLPTAGHTAGHTTYVVQSKGEKLVIWGDLVHVGAVQFPDPSVTISFDSDTKQAYAQRKRAFAEATKQGYWIAAAHLAFPGLGHVRAEGKGYAWVPANYANPR